MEHASAASRMSLPENLRIKQKEAIEAFQSTTALVIQLPTGYGKTITAAGCFAQLRYRGVCNRMLYIVPRGGQASQAADDLPSGLRLFGIETKAIIVGSDPLRAQNAHVKNTMCVFVATVQSLLTKNTWGTITELMQTGKWFVVVDEHHHYSNDESAWTGKLKGLNYCAILAMSATPNRQDGSDHFGDPDIKESYTTAANAGIVKRLSLHAYHYEIDTVSVDGMVHQFTTESLAEESGSSKGEAIDAYLAARKLRFSPKYISPLVTFPVDRLIDLRTRLIRSQMLIQAMSCWHARSVYDQVRLLIPDHMSVEWVGTGPNGRSHEENLNVLRRFCPPKDPSTGRRDWSLDILINVGIAGEGLDCMDVTEIVFLTQANLTISNKQTIGRAARSIPTHPKTPGHINVDTGSPMSDLVGHKIMGIFDNKEDVAEDDLKDDKNTDDDQSKDRDYEYRELPEQLEYKIADVRLVDIRSEPMFQEIMRQVRPKVDQIRTDEEVASIVEMKIREHLNRGNNASAIYAQTTEQINSAVSKISGLVRRRMSESGLRVERSLAGDLCRRINTRKKIELGAISQSLDESSLDRHWQWLKKLERQILLDHGLAGVPQWLR